MKLDIRAGTPVDEVRPGLWVKREDLCCPFPGPSFAKIRGVAAHIQARPHALIGVLDTFHSKAGWAVAYVCRMIGRQCLDFFPVYKGDGEDLRTQQAHAHVLGAELRGLPAGRSAILFHAARKATEAAGGYMMPNALKLPETVNECRKEVLAARLPDVEHLVISVSSGTIAAGVMRGFADLAVFPRVWLHMGYDRSEAELQAYLREYVGNAAYEALRPTFINEHYAYKDTAPETAAPFPCNPYYDLKAWAWLMKNPRAGRTLFWNIGS